MSSGKTIRIRRKLIKENPAGLLTAFRKTASDIEDMKSREENIWTYEDFQKFIVCLEGKPYQALFYTLFNTGINGLTGDMCYE